MTEQEAIKYLNSACLMLACEYHIGNHRCNDDYDVKEARKDEAIETAIKSLETVAEMNKRNIKTETIIEYAKFEDECIQKGFTFKSLLEAREKQIPKKPIPVITSDNEFICMICPSCQEIAVDFNDKHCRRCGQKILWSEEE